MKREIKQIKYSEASRSMKREMLRSAMKNLGYNKINKRLNHFWTHPKDADKILKQARMVQV